MTVKQRDLFNNIGKPQYALLNSIYDLNKRDIRELKQRDLEMLRQYDNWENHEDRKTLIEIINDYCNAYRCLSI